VNTHHYRAYMHTHYTYERMEGKGRDVCMCVWVGGWVGFFFLVLNCCCFYLNDFLFIGGGRRRGGV
jgi:hypothetical protein